MLGKGRWGRDKSLLPCGYDEFGKKMAPDRCLCHVSRTMSQSRQSIPECMKTSSLWVMYLPNNVFVEAQEWSHIKQEKIDQSNLKAEHAERTRNVCSS
jgi:hypothetical protein